MVKSKDIYFNSKIKFNQNTIMRNNQPMLASPIFLGGAHL
jgi:hypothetical protein